MEIRRPREPATAWSIDYDCRLAWGFWFLFKSGGSNASRNRREMNHIPCLVKARRVQFRTEEPERTSMVPLRTPEEVQMSDPKDWTRKTAAGAKREEREALESAVSALEGEEGAQLGERPEALAQFAQSARKGEGSPKQPTADEETAPEPTSNADKHGVATRLLNKGAKGDHPDPDEEGAGNLPDRIRDRG
jgi:hypothetical protein